MHARGWQLALTLVSIVVAASAARADDPKPTPVDIKPFKDKLQVFVDAKGGTYVVFHEPDQDSQVFYGPKGKPLYAQIVTGRSRDGDAWSISTWAPRVKEIRPGEIRRKQDATFEKSCDGDDDAVLTLLTGDKAKAVLDKPQFFTAALIRRPYLLARDDAGVYYYVDYLHKPGDRHGFSHRVYVGKKGAMKLVPLTDVASDSAGDVFSTKSGDLRLVKSQQDSSKNDSTWVKGEKRTALVSLDLDVNSHLIFSELGIYTFLGTICDGL